MFKKFKVFLTKMTVSKVVVTTMIMSFFLAVGVAIYFAKPIVIEKPAGSGFECTTVE
jgi:hypothetical protein